jgi:two-component system response regulator MprA
MGHRILVVDDDQSIREAIEGVLELEGYAIELAADGVEALQKVTVKPPTLMLLDMMMPRMDGFAVVAELKRQGLRSQFPVIVLTADGSAEAKAAQIGANGYIIKPFSLNALIAEVARVIGPV